MGAPRISYKDKSTVLEHELAEAKMKLKEQAQKPQEPKTPPDTPTEPKERVDELTLTDNTPTQGDPKVTDPDPKVAVEKTDEDYDYLCPMCNALFDADEVSDGCCPNCRAELEGLTE